MKGIGDGGSWVRLQSPEAKKSVLLEDRWIEGRDCLRSFGLMGKPRKIISVWESLPRQSVGSNRKKVNGAEERLVNGNGSVLCGAKWPEGYQRCGRLELVQKESLRVLWKERHPSKFAGGDHWSGARRNILSQRATAQDNKEKGIAVLSNVIQCARIA
jgi:hypothetical protein